jgi:hypothetical protein
MLASSQRMNWHLLAERRIRRRADNQGNTAARKQILRVKSPRNCRFIENSVPDGIVAAILTASEFNPQDFSDGAPRADAGRTFRPL